MSCEASMTLPEVRNVTDIHMKPIIFFMNHYSFSAQLKLERKRLFLKETEASQYFNFCVLVLAGRILLHQIVVEYFQEHQAREW